MPDESKESLTLEEQIEEMIEDMEPVEEAEEVEDEVVEEPVEEEGGGEPSGEVVEPEEEPEEEEEPKGPEEPEVEVEERAEQEEPEVVEEAAPEDDITAFRDRINKIAEAALRQGVQLPADLLGIEEEEGGAPPVEQQPPQTLQQPAPPMEGPAPGSYEEFQILTEGMSFDDFMDDEEKFASGMRNILSRHEQMLAQRYMSSIPNIVQNQVRQIVALQRATDDFYNKNEDLKEVRPTVGAVANQIVARHPDWDVGRVMEESAKTTRRLLRMPSPRVGGTKVVRPSFAKQSGTQQRNKPKPKMSKLQREIDELLE